MRRYLLSIFSLILAYGFVSGQIPAVSAAESSSEEFTLEEITVTAQKREANQQKVAMAMQVLSGADLVQDGKNDIQEILGNLSNALIQVADDGLKVTIRGISQDGSTFGDLQTKTPTVAINTDGVYSNRNDGSKNLFDIERVEVLYGPQSTLYASATPGGIVNIITANPKIDKVEVGGVAEFGSYNLLHMEGIMNVPLGEKWAFRAGFTANSRKGYVSNGSGDEDSQVGRLKALFKPTENFSVVLVGEYTKSGGQGEQGVVLFVNQDDVDNPWTSTYQTARPPRTTIRKKYYGSIDMDFGFANLTIIPSYTIKNRELTSSSTTVSSTGVVSTSSTTGDGEGVEKGLEGRIVSSASSSIKWIGGFNYYNSLDKVKTLRFLNNASNGFQDTSTEATTKALYGNITYPLTDAFRATGGVRYSKDLNVWINDESPAPPGKVMPEKAIPKYDGTDYKLGIEYDLGASSMVFADYSSGYRVQGAGTDRNGNAIKPEHLTAYTLGTKNRFLGNKLQVNATAYYYDYKDQLAVTGVSTIRDANQNGIRDYTDANGNGIYDAGELYTENTVMNDEAAKQVGNLEVYGFDLQTTMVLSQADRVDFSVSYNEKKWTKLYFDWWDITNSLGLADLDYSGNTSTFAPKWGAQLEYQHNFLLANGATLSGKLSSRYSSSYKMFFLDYAMSIAAVTTTSAEVRRTYIAPYAHQEPYILGDVQAIYNDPTGKWSFSGYVKNVTNYAVKKQIKVQGANSSQLNLGPPRTYGAVLTVKY